MLTRLTIPPASPWPNRLEAGPRTGGLAASWRCDEFSADLGPHRVYTELPEIEALLPELIASGYAASVVAPDLVTTLPASASAPGRLASLTLDGSSVRMPVGTTLDPGGIGKGLAADIICEFGLAEGAWGIMAEISGDIVVAGRR